MQSSTVGCRFDRTSKTMYYFVKFGRYFTWLMEDKLEMVVRYADNKDVAGQQVAESEVLVFIGLLDDVMDENWEDQVDTLLTRKVSFQISSLGVDQEKNGITATLR
uniref:Uncharacterized protein n=1 Tax=Romanomermis culicivorax TaxID=13658 RepID=A0A915LAJ2_ROMCU